MNYEGAIWAQTFLRNSPEMLADSKWIKEVLGKEVENRGRYDGYRNIYFFPSSRF